MAVSKIVYGGDTLVDLTGDTVTAEALLEGYTAHGADGEPIIGTHVCGGTGGGSPEPGDTLDNTDWETISAISQAGEASAYWSVGDSKSVEVNGTVAYQTFDHEVYYAYILGFDHNADLEGANVIHWQFAKTEDGTDIAFCDSRYGSSGSSVRYYMNSSNTNSGGWASCYMRETICPQFLEALPDDLQAVIRDVVKYTDNTGGGSGSVSGNITSTTDKIFLLSEYEVQGARTSANSYEKNYQQQYDYYAAGNSKIKQNSTDVTSACYWWTRSPCYSASTYFCSVSTGGGAGSYSANRSRGFAPGFTV